MQGTLKALSDLIRWINQQGWSPATSTNYSCFDAEEQIAYVSRSGLDKSRFTPQDFIPMSLEGNHRAGFEAVKSSAETGIHLMLYQQRDCKVILHTHSKADTLISRVYHAAKQIELEGYELLKGLRDIDTHESQTIVPIFDNDQDISRLSGEMKRWLEQHPDCQGLLIERHGFYCWGRDLAEAKRHLEVFQFLFDQELEWLKLSALK